MYPVASILIFRNSQQWSHWNSEKYFAVICQWES